MDSPDGVVNGDMLNEPDATTSNSDASDYKDTGDRNSTGIIFFYFCG